MGSRPLPLRALWHAPSRSAYVCASGPKAEAEARWYVRDLRAGRFDATPLAAHWRSTPPSEWSIVGCVFDSVRRTLRRLPGVEPIPLSEI